MPFRETLLPYCCRYSANYCTNGLWTGASPKALQPNDMIREQKPRTVDHAHYKHANLMDHKVDLFFLFAQERMQWLQRMNCKKVITVCICAAEYASCIHLRKLLHRWVRLRLKDAVAAPLVALAQAHVVFANK